MISKKGTVMKSGSTMFLKAVVIGIGLVGLGLCVFGLPSLISTELSGDFDYGPIFLWLYVPALPFFFALRQAFKLLSYIEKNRAFSKASVRALKNIKYCALAISALFVLGMPYVFYLADRDDAPGVAAIGFVIVGASFVIATAAAVFQRLLQNAVDIKSENDLTV